MSSLVEEHPFLVHVKNLETLPYEGMITYSSNPETPEIAFEGNGLKGLLRYTVSNNTLFVTVAGTVANTGSGKVLDYLAPSPITRGYSYSGSGLPYPNAEVAYESTPSMGSVTLDEENDFAFTIEYPNSYYIRQGTVLVGPHVHIYDESRGHVWSISVGEPLPNRSLTGLPGRPDRSTRR